MSKKISKAERTATTLKALEKLKTTNLNHKLVDPISSQINIYLSQNGLIVYYVMRKSMYYKKNTRENRLKDNFYDIKRLNVELEDVIGFAKIV